MKRLRTLAISQLLTEGRPARFRVACGAKRNYSWDDFRQHVAGCCFQLRHQPGGRWLLNCRSSYAFGVGLFALWHTGRTAVLAPNQQPESFRESSKDVGGVLSDGSHPGKSLPCIAPLARSRKAGRWRELDSRRCRLMLWTSGSTGQKKAVTKTLDHLQAEVTILEKTFGHLLDPGAVVSTVSHQHIYGLLFRLLWPLYAGRAFFDETFLFWEELSAHLQKSAGFTLIASPSHLERLTPSGAKALASRKGGAIFSSGGPLAESAIKRVIETFGHAPIEVFGSTETGGVGWRQWRRSAPQPVWQPLEGVIVSVDPLQGNRLIVESPFVSAPGARFLMGDSAIVQDNGTFLLHGRQDRIVKIAEKRVSLDDMEMRLGRHPWVERARVMFLPKPTGHSRTALGAAVLLKRTGKEALKREGAAAMSKTLREFLHRRFDWSSVPRSFRFPETWPLDPQGKFSQDLFAPLFRNSAEMPVRWPEIVGETVSGTKLVRELRVPSNLSYLEGHFPKYPVVPGVVQLAWVLEAATEWLGWRPVVRRMDAVKFRNVLLPGQRFSLEMTRTLARNRRHLDFALTHAGSQFSSGRLVFKS